MHFPVRADIPQQSPRESAALIGLITPGDWPLATLLPLDHGMLDTARDGARVLPRVATWRYTNGNKRKLREARFTYAARIKQYIMVSFGAELSKSTTDCQLSNSADQGLVSVKLGPFFVSPALVTGFDDGIVSLDALSSGVLHLS
ncbi:hypothetical protein RRG08_042451 [Elysia crispata]|uniref:Uncharacterized protein n=1 Tax=Elysia crispata TaxID=231223 RepID=A0AAE0ZC15_9GAST|nr:hypothetical protein RRG08_042451 [Elysia crispata]